MTSPFPIAVTIDESLRNIWPAAALGCVLADVHNAATPPELEQELAAAERKIAALPEPRAVLESTAIQTTRRAYKACGKDPARYRGSAEALLRRLIAGKGLPRISAVVDIINLVSVESRLCIGLYDTARISGGVTFRTGRAGETYKGIGKYDLNLEGLPVFCDAQGPHGSPTSDSERTMVTLDTQRVLGIIMSFAGGAPLAAATERLRTLLERHAAGSELVSFVTAGA